MLLTPVVMSAQIVTQKGVAYRYNGEQPRTPLGNVTISYDANKRTTVSGEQDGAFSLTLDGRRMGDRIGLVTVKKREMMVFNQQAVDEWSVRKEPLMLILCNADEFERQKENFINIGRRKAKKEYERQKAELQAQLDESKIQLAEYESRLDKAYEDLDRLNKEIEKYADELARVDRSEIEAGMREVLSLYEQGEVEKALKKLEGLNLTEGFEKTLSRKAYHEQGMETAVKDSAMYVNEIKSAAKVYQNSGEYEKAGEYLKLLADKLHTVDDNWAYAYFCDNQNNFKDAEIYYQQVLALLDRQTDKESLGYQSQKASLLNNLAILYSDTQRLADAEKMYKEALETYRRLAQANPQAYESDVAGTQNNLANLYYATQRLADAEKMFLSALAIRERLAQANPQAYEPDVAHTMNNLANLYSDTQRFDDAEKMFLSALAICERLAQANPQAYEPGVAQTQYNIGLLKVNQEQYTDAIPAFEEALDIYRRLAKVNPAQQQWYEGSLYYLSILYPTVNNYSAAYRINQEWLPILKTNNEDSPDDWRSYYTETLGSQSFYAILMKQHAESEQLAREGLAVDSSRHFIYTNLAAALLFQGKYTEAEKIYRQYKDELKDSFLNDFKQFAEADVIPKEREADVEKIKQMLNE